MYTNDPIFQVEWINIGFVSDGNNIEALLGLIKNILLLRQFPLHLHIVTTKTASIQITNKFLNWNIHRKHFNFSFYDYTLCEPYVKPYAEWIHIKRYIGSVCKIALPYIISESVKYLLVLDTDIVLLDGSLHFYRNCYYHYIRAFEIAELEERRLLNIESFHKVPPISKKFNQSGSYIIDVENIRQISFNYVKLPPRPVIAIAPDHHDEHTPVAIWPHLKEGTLNGGVLLIDCYAYRLHRLWEQILYYNYAEQAKRGFSKTKLYFGDQNLLNLFLSDHISSPGVQFRKYTLVLPCSCNYIFQLYIKDNYRQHVCPIESEDLIANLDEYKVSVVNIERTIVEKNLILQTKSDAELSVEKIKIHLMSLMGWQQKQIIGIRRNITRTGKIYIGHAAGDQKNVRHVFNEFRKLYLEYDDKYLRQINCWNIHDIC